MKLRPARAPQRFVIDDPSKVGEVRRAAQTLASYELDTDLTGKAAIIATELANNLSLHAGGGEVLMQILGSEATTCLEFLALDKGPGMVDVSRCLMDGYSTAGTPGTGLGAVRRMATEFDIHSSPGEGTAVMARLGAPQALRYGAVSVPIEGEVECGDAWSLNAEADSIALLVVDGLGHGAFAAEAARVAVGAFESAPQSTPVEVMTRAHGLMSKTRGGAAAAALWKGGTLSYSGIGNIAGALVSAGRSQGLVSHNGTLGMGTRRAQQFEYEVEPGALLVMHSDGISARWDLKNRADLMNCHPAIIAGVIYRDHARGSDDATVVVVAT